MLTPDELRAEREAHKARRAVIVEAAIERVKERQENRKTFWLNVRHKPIHLPRAREP